MANTYEHLIARLGKPLLDQSRVIRPAKNGRAPIVSEHDYLVWRCGCAWLKGGWGGSYTRRRLCGAEHDAPER